MDLGQKAPDFSLLDQNEKDHKLSNYRGQWVLIYFYPKDNTPGCTKEACGIRDNYSQYEKNNIKVLGISCDSVKSHENFTEKFNLPFTLLSDNEKKVVKLYGVWKLKKMMGREYYGIQRTSFLVDPKGKIAKIYKTVKPQEHAQQVLKDLEELMLMLS